MPRVRANCHAYVVRIFFIASVKAYSTSAGAREVFQTNGLSARESNFDKGNSGGPPAKVHFLLPLTKTPPPLEIKTQNMYVGTCIK